jgi:hypothetical protein
MQLTSSHGAGLAQFELEWFGGPVEQRFRRRRGGVEDLPWGSFDAKHLDAAELQEARSVWTNGAFTEVASAAAFSAFATSLLECGAPIDLVAVAADFVVDEASHAEIASRLVAEMGGATPFEVSMERISPATTPGVSALLRAAEIAVKTSCVGEALSVPALSVARSVADQPLVHAVLAKLLADEGPHSRIGDWFLDWAEDRLSDHDRAHLAGVALDAVEVYAPLWQRTSCGCPDVASAGVAPADDFSAAMISAVRTRIAGPLARRGIHIAGERLDALVAR